MGPSEMGALLCVGFPKIFLGSSSFESLVCMGRRFESIPYQWGLVGCLYHVGILGRMVVGYGILIKEKITPKNGG